MKHKPSTSGMGKYDSEGFQREQALCRDALATQDFDNLSDKEWVALCESVGAGKKSLPAELQGKLQEVDLPETN